MGRGEIRSTVGRRIKEYREGQRIGLTELARLTDVSRSYLYQIESGESSPTARILKSIARALGVTVSDLLDEEYPLEIPESLEKFAEEDNIEPGYVRMLAQIHHRGRQPNTPEEWRLLWRLIRATIGEEDLSR